MARGGVNKKTVKVARDSVVLMGRNPSIDAVRIELGNTGSKTTIHRYLKELSEEDDVRLEEQGALSSTLQELVARLANQLQDEAQTIVDNDRQQHTAQVEELEQQVQKYTEDSIALEQKNTELKYQLDKVEALHQTSIESLQASHLQSLHLEERVINLSDLAAEKGRHIESLEEKHLHSREALEHYRQSVKDQRDQDQRKHEQQIQQAQMDLRDLNQTVLIRQGDIVQLNKENGGLTVEVKGLKSKNQELDSKIYSSQISINTISTELALKSSELDNLKGSYIKKDEELALLKEQLTYLDTNNRTLELDKEKALAELKIKNELFNSLAIEQS